ncbi:MAG: sensor histidine kinase [Marmoricola sp.]
MRRRLVAAFIGLAVLVVALYVVPRAYVVSDLIHSSEQHRVDDTATLVAHIIGDGSAPVSTSFLDSINGDYEWIVVRRGADAITTTGAERGAGENDLTATRSIAGGTVTVGLSGSVVSSAVSDALVPLILLGLGIILAAALAGYLLARRFAQPFQELAVAARGLGEGRLRPALPRYSVAEHRAIAKALTDSGEQIEAMLAHERTVAAHASHELRTPIAALRLELEDVALWPETPASVATQLRTATGELDRLASAVGDLLTLSRQHRERDEVDVNMEDLVDETLHGLDQGQGRVVHVRHGSVPARLDPAPVKQLVRTVIELALAGGGGSVHVSSSSAGSHVEVRVAQDSAAVSGTATPAALAELAASLGARLARDASGFVIRLPAHLPG